MSSLPPLRIEPSEATRLDGDEAVTIAPRTDRVAARKAGVVVGPPSAPDAAGRRSIEVVVDGWHFDLVVEDAGRAELRERASRERSGRGGGGPAEIRAIIPGRIVSVAVVPGDHVGLGDAVLVGVAMKMQNEVRAPRDGTVTRVAVAAGETVEPGTVMVVLE
jgi:biotin carboxyl carrier protein